MSSIDTYAFLFGLVGFLGFEALRIYKDCLPTGKAAYGKSNRAFVLVVVILVGAFAGTAAAVLTPGEYGKCLYVGFSLPTAANFLLRKSASDRSEITVDDVALDDSTTVSNNSSRPGSSGAGAEQTGFLGAVRYYFF